jgi:hypothetical protein
VERAEVHERRGLAAPVGPLHEHSPATGLPGVRG